MRLDIVPAPLVNPDLRVESWYAAQAERIIFAPRRFELCRLLAKSPQFHYASGEFYWHRDRRSDLAAKPIKKADGARKFLHMHRDTLFC